MMPAITQAAEASSKANAELEADIITEQEWDDLVASYPEEERGQCQPFLMVLCRQVNKEGDISLIGIFEPDGCDECQAAKMEERDKARIQFEKKPMKVVMLKEGDAIPQAVPAAAAAPPSTSSRRLVSDYPRPRGIHITFACMLACSALTFHTPHTCTQECCKVNPWIQESRYQDIRRSE